MKLRKVLLMAGLIMMLGDGAMAAQSGRGGGSGTAQSPASARPSFTAKAAPQGRATPQRLPRKAIPIAQQRSDARPRLMAEQVHRISGKNRVSINGSNGRVMVTDVAARRQSGEMHRNRQTGERVRLPHVRYDQRVVNTSPAGKAYPKTIKGETRAASIQELRTARRFAERQARSRPSARRGAAH